jgi:Coenzyme PQQ synthesis protein D (PqqD)
VPVRYCHANRTVWRRTHDTVLVRAVARNEVLVLTGAGSDLWQLCREPLTLDQAAHRLAEAYEVPPEQIEHDIALLIDDLTSRGVLDRLDSP